MNDIFVSYAGVDNQVLGGAENGWVTEFIANLKIFLDQTGLVYSLWMDDGLRGNQKRTPEIINQLENSSTLLVILSPAYIKSEWCMTEFNVFLTLHDSSSRRVFVVEYNNVVLPSQLNDLLGYKFWYLDAGRPRTFAIPIPNPKEPEYYQLLQELAHDFFEKITFLRNQPAATPSVAPGQKTVFLAEVSDDLENYRNDVKCYLQDKGLRVLRDKKIGKNQQYIDNNLNQCSLFVQLLSEQVNNHLPVFQYQRAKIAADTTDLKILQWYAKGLNLNDVQDKEHKALLSQSTVIASSIVDFQEHVINQLNPKPKSAIKIDKTQGDYLVFINAAPNYGPLANEIIDVLINQGIGCALPPPVYPKINANERDKYIDQLYLECDAVIVVYDDTQQWSWAYQQLLRCRKMHASRDRPFKLIAVYDKPLQDKRPLLIYLKNLLTLDCPTPETDTCLPEFIRILTQ